ncbi:helix-turn-helix transcriptional regulator [uncultured Bacteroides sp.]|uniref:helix-turn-helix domain-containing protein n=1 Tax=uncultured Bacteroides sp. TaxID=162156 RepID=UPI002AAAA052|nr:helix-turn-helix transcriptional regulator [uncultured Bacteroides sp.]
MKHNARIFVDQGILVYAGKSCETKEHKHYAIQIGIVLGGIYKLYIDKEEHTDESFIIHSNIPHKHISIDGALLCILIDPTTALGHTLISNFPAPYQPLPISSKALMDLKDEISHNTHSIANLKDRIFELLNLAPTEGTTDYRISLLIEKISSANTLEINLDTLIKDIPLSKSRIRSLFKENTGLSIQRYILWIKIKKAFYYIMQNQSLSEAAFLAGFADYAHLSRVIHQISGLDMKTLLKDSYLVQDS